MSSMLELVVSCIEKDSEKRSDNEINNLLPWLRQMSDKFESLKTEVLFEILKNCSYSEKSRNDIIIRQGDKGDCFYVILSGKVSIYINTEAVPDNPEEAIILVTEDKMRSDGGSKKELDRSKYGNFIALLESGKAFGELALINADCVRNASIIADEMVQLLIVNRELYNRSMKEAELHEFNNRMNFVNNSELFSNWISKYKRQAAFSLRKEKFAFNVPLVNQGAPINGLIFILSGQAKVVVNTYQHEIQFPSLDTVKPLNEIGSIDINEIERTADGMDNKRYQHNYSNKRLNYVDAEQRLAQKNIEVCIVSAGEIIGDIEQGLELSTYSHSVITIEPTIVYILDAKNYERLINAKRNPRTLKILRAKAVNKIKYRTQITEGKFVSFYTKLNKIIQDEEERELKATLRKAETFEIQRTSLERMDPAAIIASHRGPLIDMYGPGSIFHRNRIKRKEKIQADKKRKEAQLTVKGQKGFHKEAKSILELVNGLNNEESDSGSIDDYPAFPIDVPSANEKALTEIPINTDWETTSEKLRGLETRIKKWLVSVSELKAESKVDDITEYSPPYEKAEYLTALKRFNPLESEKKIIPGKKIFLTPKHKPKRVVTAIDDSRKKIFITAGELNDRKKSVDIEKDNDDFDNSIPSSLNNYTSDNCKEKKKKSANEKIHLPRIHQYTPSEYKELKQLLKKKEIEMQIFQTSLAI